MTREEAKELLPIIQAFAEGKTMQWLDRDGVWNDVIGDDAKMYFNQSAPHYRIKPKPRCRPFKNKEECWNEMLKHHPFGWLKSKKAGSVGLIGTLYTKDEVLMIIWATNEYNSYSSFDVFNDYVFTDGEPFGINEE